MDHLISYFFMKASTSSRRGIEGMAPILVMQRNAALLPNSMAARQLASLFSGDAQSSSECLTANAPVKQSPAPTVSTILYSPRMALLMEVTTSPRTTTSLVIMADPLLPSLSSTRRLGCLASSLPLISLAMKERSSSCWLMTMELSSLSSSVSLGEIQVMLSRSSSEMGSSLPPQSRMTTLDLEYAYLAAARLISMGTSFCRRRQSDASMTFLNAWSMSWRLSNSMLVPPQMTMEFSPWASTQMQAMPVYLPSRTFHWRSTLAAFISISSLVLASSLPTCPRKQLLPASLPTETAWLAPLPPLAVKYLWDCMVSPTAGILLTQRKWSELALPNTHIFLCPSICKSIILIDHHEACDYSLSRQSSRSYSYSYSSSVLSCPRSSSFRLMFFITYSILLFSSLSSIYPYSSPNIHSNFYSTGGYRLESVTPYPESKSHCLVGFSSALLGLSMVDSLERDQSSLKVRSMKVACW